MNNTASDSKNLEWEWSPVNIYGLGEDSPQNYPAMESDPCACNSRYCVECSRSPMPRPDPNLIDWVGKGAPGVPLPPASGQSLSYRAWLLYYKTKRWLTR